MTAAQATGDRVGLPVCGVPVLELEQRVEGVSGAAAGAGA